MIVVLAADRALQWVSELYSLIDCGYDVSLSLHNHLFQIDNARVLGKVISVIMHNM